MYELDRLYEIAEDPAVYAREWKAAGRGSVVGYFCSYTPEEIIVAAGALPVRIFGSGASLSKADAHLQAYACSLVRGALEDALGGALDFLDGAVFPHTCDSIQRLSDIWRINGRFGFHLDVVMPAKLDTDSARQYMTRVLETFRRQLQDALGVDIGPERLAGAAAVCNRLRRALRRLYELKSEHPVAISGRDLNTIVKAAMVMDRQEAAERLERVAAGVEGREPVVPGRQAKRLVLSGGLCNLPDIYQIIEDAGGVVAWDDLCTGTRSFEGRLPTEGDMLPAIARRYLERIVCPAKHSGLDDRGDHLVQTVQQVGACGVIFVFLKFCDPHGFDYPYLKSALDAAGIPSMMFEIEDRLPGEGQLRTRIEAFLEMVD
jgi:bzd-type benzoyl-CoA reductase N subunit